MLVLSRKCGERIVVPQSRLTITVGAIKGNSVRLVISAPTEIGVYREEVWRRDCRKTPDTSALPGDRAGSLAGAAQRGGN
jgi:carbon storage regulator